MHTPRSKASQTRTTASLFTKGLAEWVAQPELAFDTWLIRSSFGKRSFIVYSTQWRVFTKWCKDHHLVLNDVSPVHIREFLGGLFANKLNQRQRYLRLIERAFDAMHESIDRNSSCLEHLVNPVRSYQVLFDPYWKQAKTNDATFFYSPAQCRQLHDYLLNVVAPDPADPSRPFVCSNGKSWSRNIRDRALAASFLCAGLKVSVALALKTSDIIPQRNRNSIWIKIAGSAAHVARTQTLQDPDASWLVNWSEHRLARSQHRHVLLFCSQKDANGMHPSTVARVIRDFFKPLSFVDPRFGVITAQRLRNSYAAGLFEQNLDMNEIAQRLGYADVTCAYRLQQAWQLARQHFD